jgi:hypothetical protein
LYTSYSLQKQFPKKRNGEKMKRTGHSTRLNDWQEAGVILGGILVDSARLINQALPEIADAQHCLEIEWYISGTEHGPFPSAAALQSLKTAILTGMMAKPE